MGDQVLILTDNGEPRLMSNERVSAYRTSLRRRACVGMAMGLILAATGTTALGHGRRSPASFTSGNFLTTDAGGDRGFDVAGRAVLVRHGSGETEAFSFVTGLAADTAYGSHVHNLPCDVSHGGGHYKIDPNVAGAEPENEIWPALSTDGDGVGFGYDAADHIARPEAQSIVVHDGDGTRIACADLRAPSMGARRTAGHFETLPGGEALGLDISGVAQLVRSNGRTLALVNANGLLPDATLGTHVHNLPCDVNSGGGHYKIDPNVEGASAENEIWPIVTTDGSGTGLGQADVGHTARPEAQSVVIHAPDGTRVACADLGGPSRTELTTGGPFLTTAAGLARGYTVHGQARMIRSARRTTVHVDVSGLARRTTYPAHVHDRPCRLGGGGHYEIDTEMAGAVESNEMWPTIRTRRRGSGRGFARTRHLARPEAQSVVIHDPDDGARLACADLD